MMKSWKNINLKNLPKNSNKKNDKIGKKKNHGGWNCKKKNLKNDSKQNK